MRIVLGIGVVAAMGAAVWLAANATAQPPGGPPGRARERGRPVDVSGAVNRMMTFDANHDGELSKEELTDTRLLALFESADANQDGKVTGEELTAQLTKDAESLGAPGRPGGGPPEGWPEGERPGRRGPDRRDVDRPVPERRGPGGPGAPGRPPGPGPFGPGFGRPGPGGPPPIGQVMPEPVQDMLKLSVLQKRKIDALQRQVDRKLAEILTEDQRQQLEEFGDRGPGGPGGPRGRSGPPGGGGPPSRRGDRDELNPPPPPPRRTFPTVEEPEAESRPDDHGEPRH